MDSRINLSTPDELAKVVITSQLQERAPRFHDLKKENEAFRDLATQLATAPAGILDCLVELTVRLCDADTVGISLEESNEKGERIFRWIAMAGELKHLIGGTTPRNFSPCGVCVDQNEPLLMSDIDRAYPYFKEAPLPFVEALLIPWGIDGGPVGTLWIVAHSERRKFDREDVRLMNCLAAFVAGAMRLRENISENEHVAASTHVVSEMTHHINNPLQAAILALYVAQSLDEKNPDVEEMIKVAQRELRRVVELSSSLLLQLKIGERANARI
jgi:signal transduction histidine kinase